MQLSENCVRIRLLLYCSQSIIDVDKGGILQFALRLPHSARRISLDGTVPVLVLFLFLKIVFGLLGVFIVTHYFTINPKGPAAFLYQAIVPGGFQNGQALSDLTLWPWMRWDTELYLRIALYGYQTGGSASFAPIYPALIRLLMVTGINPITASLIISNLSLIFTCLLLYKEALDRFDSQTAFRSILYFLVFPSAVFLFAGYSESLFILFLLLAWRAGHAHRWLWMALLGLLGVLTRFQGICLALPLGYIWWKDRKTAPFQGLYLLLIPAGLAAWSMLVKFGLHTEFPWEALQQGFSATIAWPWDSLWGGFQAMIGPHPFLPDFMDFSLTIIFIILAVIAAFKLPGEYSLLMIAILIPPLVKVAFNYPLMSMSRYLLPLFPGFLLLARAGRSRVFNFLWLVISMILMGLAAAGFFLWQWVA